MIHIRKFANYEEFMQAESSLEKPNLSLCVQERIVNYIPRGGGGQVDVTGVTLSKNTMNLEKGGKERLLATVLPLNATNKAVVWQSSNTNVATVDSNGLVSAVGNGNANITVTTVDGGFTAQCSVTCVLPYAEQYLTLVATSNGTILWKTVGSLPKTISYSTDEGQNWTQITSTSAGVAINVNSGDRVLVKGTNTQYSTSKSNYSAFQGGTATFNVEGNIMSLVYGDEFVGQTALTATWTFSSLFNNSKAVSAKNLILPSMSLTQHCYRAMFANTPTLVEAPELPAITLADACYCYMFEKCAIVKAPDLMAETVPSSGYGHTFDNCNSLNYIKCLATNIGNNGTQGWVQNGVASTGTFIKNPNKTWSTGISGIPNGWTVYDYEAVEAPTVACDGSNITLTCSTTGANIYYRLNYVGDYALYSEPIAITADTVVETYSEKDGTTSITKTETCYYISDDPYEASNRTISTWKYNNQEVTVPYSINAIDGHSSAYTKGTFSFETNVVLKEAQPTYLWFEHADQSANIYVDDTLVETHWGGYNAFFTDITNYVHTGTNVVKVALTNTTRDELAPNQGDFNFYATLGYTKLFTSPVLPSKDYGYDGFHVTSDVSSASATINIKTSIPTGATVICKIDDGNTNVYSATSASTNAEMTFTATIQNPHLWNGTIDPHLYNITLEIYHNGQLYHRYTRPYGLRFYEYVINDTEKAGTAQNPYTGFLLNGSPYYLRGVCMHSDKEGKANALTSADIAADFDIINELGCNFVRLVHYQHPKEVYDYCDRLGIVVSTEAPWVNDARMSLSGTGYYEHLDGQYVDMVNQHYNHPSIMFWCLSNETTANSDEQKEFIKTKIESYATHIKSLDSERLVGYVMYYGSTDPSSYYKNPNVDWFGSNLYVGWYQDQNTNNPTNQINTRVTNIITNKQKAFALSEYGCGGTQHCHSDDPQTTTTKGNNPRHDIEYQMWLHEGHIAAIRNFPQLLFTAQWQLFDVAVSKRNEGYTVCLDGENTTTDDNLKYLNNKGLVERDHVTKKDTFYLYKAEWSSQKFVHICGKDYTKKTNRTIKCYSNDGSSLSLYVNGTFKETVSLIDNIATFTATNFNSNDVIRVDGSSKTDTFTFE